LILIIELRAFFKKYIYIYLNLRIVKLSSSWYLYIYLNIFALDIFFFKKKKESFSKKPPLKTNFFLQLIKMQFALTIIFALFSFATIATAHPNLEARERVSIIFCNWILCIRIFLIFEFRWEHVNGVASFRRDSCVTIATSHVVIVTRKLNGRATRVFVPGRYYIYQKE
jgi:hypothetical protein